VENKIIVGSHDYGGGGFHQNLEDAVRELKQEGLVAKYNYELEIKTREEVKSLSEFPIAFCHTGSDSTWEDLISSSEPGQIRIRLSSSGFSSKPEPFTSPFKKNGVYVFHLLKSSRVTSTEEWKSIIEGMMNQNVVADLVAGKDPHGLASFFIRKTQNVLIALSILCQGYLAVHARKQNGEWGPPDIVPALKQMGWLDFIDGPGKSLFPKDLDKKKSEVSQARWWLEPFELLDKDGIIQGEWPRYEESLMKEWGKGDTTLPKKIVDLLEPLSEDKDISNPKIVSDAYCVIVKNLGGAPCSSN